MNLNGLLFFPVTPFAADGSVDIAAFTRHVVERIDDGAACVFAACGTGEFHALSSDEHRAVTTAAIAAAAGRVPVFVGVGGTYATARELARVATAEGASGILLMPPYLVSAPQNGLIAYVEGILAVTDLPVIVYQRGDMKFTPESVVALSRIPGVIGLKDGAGNISNMQLIVAAVRATGNASFLFFNGLPTAELTMRAYRAIGVPLYSSAVFAFAPDIALAFHSALDRDDEAEIESLLQEFFIPFVALRDRQSGNQVSLVKAAVRVDGSPVGSVRPPLLDPASDDIAALSALLVTARARLSSPADLIG